MAFTTEVDKITYAGDGVTSVFSFPYLYYAKEDLEVVLLALDGTTETILILDTDYSVEAAGSPTGGDVTIITTLPATGETLTLVRDRDNTQPDVYLSGDSFFLPPMERTYDKLVMMIQRLSARISRAALLRISSGDTPPDLEDLIQTTVSDIIRTVQFRIFPAGTAVTTGDGLAFAGVGKKYNGWKIVDIEAYVDVLGTATAAETLDIQVRRKRLAASVDVLTTKVTLDDTEYYAADGAVNTANNTLATGDRIFIDIDTVQLTTAPLGLTVDVTIQAP